MPGYDDGVFRAGSIIFRNSRPAAAGIGNFCHTPLLLQERDALCDFTPREMFYRFEQLRVLLPDDLIQFGGAHPSLHQLLEGLPGLDALMLPGIADEQYAVLGI